MKNIARMLRETLILRRMSAWMITALLLIVVAACSQDNQAGEEDPNQPDHAKIAEAGEKKVEINVFENSKGYTQEQFMNLYGNDIQKKYPNFSFKLYSLHEDNGGMGLPGLIAQGVSIDLVKVSGPTVYTLLIENGLHGDVSDLIKKFNYNWDALYPVVRETMEMYGDKGEIYGIPNATVATALYYNKDIFEKFGVEFPNPNKPMTWDETYDLARSLSRKDGDIQYSGFQSATANIFPSNQLSQGYLDPKTNQALFSHDNWKILFGNFARFHEIDLNPQLPNFQAAFWEEGRVAMYAYQSGGTWQFAINTPVDWDLVELPRFKESPDSGSGLLIPFYAVTKTSKHRDQAFLAAAHIGSEEFQREFAKEGYTPPMEISNLSEILGSNVPELSGKNLKAAVPLLSAAPTYPMNAYHSVTVAALNQAYAEVIKGTKDVNTALRDAEELANQKIQEAVAASK